MEGGKKDIGYSMKIFKDYRRLERRWEVELLSKFCIFSLQFNRLGEEEE
jgi:hypothetical protein